MANVEKIPDAELVARVHMAMTDVVSDPASRQEAWTTVIEGIRELERRYPPER